MGDNLRYNFRAKLGVLSLDLHQYLLLLLQAKKWIYVCNRNDSYLSNPDGPGLYLFDQWSSDLHACHVFPSLGKLLMRLAFRQWPTFFKSNGIDSRKPDISFVIPHRGRDRVPLLLATVKSILAQCNISVECIVIEQSKCQEISDLPSGVKYIHLPHATDPSGWHKSWAYNTGVQAACADIVVCHDGDIPVPKDYGYEILRRIAQGYDTVHLQRFLFCLDKKNTKEFIKTGDWESISSAQRIRQNWKGGTIAITRDAFYKIGGYDERYVDWGAEDNEFYDRCCVLKQWRYGYIPFIHLWHKGQASKENYKRNAEVASLLKKRLLIPAEYRIKELRQLHRSKPGIYPKPGI